MMLDLQILKQIHGFFSSTFLLVVLVVISYIGYFYIRYKYFNLKVVLPSIPIGVVNKILREHFGYYNQLTESARARFISRVLHFIASKQFIPRQLDEVTPDMKVLIAASFVQLTFGFPQINLMHFRRILVYPDSYYSTISRRHHKGEVNPQHRLIVISWKNFTDGYLNKTDSINLGLHEMAHALQLENKIRNKEYNFLDTAMLRKWDVLVAREISKLQQGESSFFRRYAGTDEGEFFSVAVENFFERPGEFKQKLPDVYAVLVKLLKQDPLELFQMAV